jgi:hypothetical protein
MAVEARMPRFFTFGFFTFGRPLPPADSLDRGPDHVAASPARIERALACALAKPAGGWSVIDASARIGASPRRVRIAGRDLVVWRTADGSLRAGPDRCPHMGASLCGARVDRGELVCPWHGLKLGARREGTWAPLAVHDDGILSWVRVPELGERPTDVPVLPERPARAIAAVVRLEARCEPRDVLANRLDPWHGVHFHPYAFLRLRTLSEDETHITVRVVYRVLGPLAIEVDARFSCPDARTIVMTIVAGEGVGSVVETHATPMDPDHTAIVEATIATSEHDAFRWFVRAQPLLRPILERRAARLWKDDAAYAERLAKLRAEGSRAPRESLRKAQRNDAMNPRGGIE